MPRLISCPSCGHQGRLPDGVPNGRVKCPKCGHVIQVPQSEPQAQAAGAEQVLDVLPAAPADVAQARPINDEVLEVVPVSAAAAPARRDRLAACGLLKPRAFRIRARSTSPNSLDYNVYDLDTK